MIAPRELCVEPFGVAVQQVSALGGDAPIDWELDGRDVPRIQATPNSTCYVQSLDPVTGLPAGSPVLAATGVVRDWPAYGIPTLGNGAEWGYSSSNSRLYFMRAYGSTGTSRQLWQAFRLPEGAWLQAALPGGEHRGFPWPSKDPGDLDPRILYAWRNPLTGEQGVATRLIPEDPDTERIIPVPVIAKIGGPRWVPGQHRVVFSTLVEGQEQVALFDADTGAVEMVTDVPGLVIDETWASAYPDGTLAVWCVIDGTEFSVWTKAGSGVWVEESWVNPAAVLDRPAKPYILSPEPFTYQGRPYIAFQLCASPGTEWQQSDFWLCEPSATTACHFRMIAPESPLARRKPEPLELVGRMVVYYSQEDAGVHSIHQAETGL